MTSKLDPWDREGLPKPGTTLLGRYRLERPLARGGMAMIYRGHDPVLDRRVAVKVMPERLKTERSHARFLREARLAAQVSHPNVVETYDAGVLESGAPFLVMELLDGETLYQHLHREGKLPLPQAFRVVEAVLDGVAAAHKRGVVHRDLKPSNVLLLPGAPHVKVIDFGLSKDLRDKGPRLTGPREALGTPSYMSPEQVMAEPVDARTDVYGTGVLFYEMVTGTRAFPKPEAGKQVKDVFAMILRDAPPPPTSIDPTLPEAVDEFVRKAMAKRPSDRFASATEMAGAAKAIRRRSGA
ncbi:MAG: serine/threonine-protein kinase [Myxococcota bacterium]